MAVTINGSAGVTTNVGAVYNGLQTSTAVASTSGTSIDFTSIPSWVKRITVMFSGVSTNGTSALQIQLGAGSVTTSGYYSNAGLINSGTGQANSTTGMIVNGGPTAAATMGGTVTITSLGSNVWVAAGNTYYTNNAGAMASNAGTVTLSGTLDRVRITTVGGTDTFDAGSINIIYE